jgi:hypothetical protein
MANRKLAEQGILAFMKDLDPSGYNVDKWETILKRMSDEDFDEYMKGLRDGTKTLVAFQVNFKSGGISLDNNLKIAARYNVNFFEKLIVSDKPGIPAYMTPIDYMVMDLPVKRQSQNLFKKISIPENNNTVDELTGQPTGASKGAKLSYPELQLLTSMGLDKSITELFKYRGGDKGGFNAYNTMAMRYGKITLQSLEPYATGVESVKTFKTLLTASHIRSTL